MINPAATTVEDTSPRGQWNHISQANNLYRARQPLHLKVDFRIFSLDGAPGETGSADLWWARRHPVHTVISSPSLQEDASIDARPSGQDREAYLVHFLLDSITQPLSPVPPGSSLEVVQPKMKRSTPPLTCLDMVPPSAHTSVFGSVCVEQGTERITSDLATGFAVVRTKPDLFQERSVGRDLSVSFAGSTAITGHIRVLEEIAADDEHLAPVQDVTAKTKPTPPERISGDAIGSRDAFGKLTKGSVLLGFLISSDGKVTNPVVLAGPNPAINDAGLTALKTWKYRPALLNGVPISTDMTVSFSTGGPS